jgi:hypothetical protein
MGSALLGIKTPGLSPGPATGTEEASAYRSSAAGTAGSGGLVHLGHLR